ncbi:MAG: heavy metal translocating P-type ATPase [Tractidigestivibacter sp.]|jgi:Cd2+/Zn2+-exporting ATPase|uniref:heavy metal translocating P-type ATPase n=1 Tax=Tractidigestivibacter sp. TaxID=2847320 RepID=UPI003D93A01D
MVCEACKRDEDLEERDEGEEEEEDEGDPKVKIVRAIISAVLLIVAYLICRNADLQTWQQLLLYLPAYLVAGYDVLLEALEAVVHGHPFNEDFLMTVATIGALCMGFVPGGETEFAEAVFVMLFFQVGEAFEGFAEGNSKRSISQLMDIRPDTANLERNGEVEVVSPSDVHPGDVIVVKPGERIALDGEVIEGTSSLDTVALTGESVPRDVSVGDQVVSGCVNQAGLLRVRVSKEFGESTASRILDLVENASSAKSKSERFISRFARVYTPIVVFAAIALAFIPPLASGDFSGTFSTWLLRALTFLVVSCPCALVISVPLAFFGGIGAASKQGILVKGSNYLEALANADIVVFDKTGTLTRGVFNVTAVHPEKVNEKQLLHLAAHVESYSTHPIGAALRAAYPETDDGCEVTGIREIAGKGVIASVNGHEVAVGNERLMRAVSADSHPCKLVGTIVHVACDGTYLGHIVISDEVKEDAADAIRLMHKEGVERCVMLTGDREEVAADVATRLGLDEYHSQLLPADKVSQVEALMGQKSGDGTLAFVGDGINDAPVLARADVGIAMGAMGSDAAIEAADVVLMDDKPSKIANGIRIARRTKKIAHQNVVFAIAVKIAILVMAAFGLAPMWLAVFGDTGVMMLSVLNSTRVLRVKKQ